MVRGRLPRDPEGFISVQYLIAMAISLVLVLTLANFVVLQFSRGVLRAALDEGARAGSRAEAGVAACETRVRAVAGQLLGGPLAQGVSVRCEQSDARVVATASGALRSVVPGLPDWPFTMVAEGVREQPP